MMTTRKGRLTDPTEHLAGQLVAALVNFLLLAVLGFAIVAFLSSSPAPATVTWLTLGLSVPALIGLQRLARKGQVRPAALALCLLALIAIATDLPVHGPNTIATGGFIIVVVIGGLTLGSAAALILAAATVLLLGAAMLAVSPAGHPVLTDAQRFAHYATQITVTSLLVAWWAAHTRRLVRQLRGSEARYAQLIEESPDAIISLDREGRTTYWNPAAESMLGFARTEVVGRDWLEVGTVPPHEVAGIRAAIARLMESAPEKRSPTMRDVELVHRNGTRLAVEAKSMTLLEDGQIVGIVSILRDVSERVRTEAERASLRAQVVSAQRMEAVGRFAGGIAHDFNNILTIILNTVEVMRTGDADADALNDIHDAATRGAALTRQLLTYSRRQPSRVQPTDIHRTVSALRPMLERLLDRDVRLELRLDADRASVVVDPSQLDQILLNLVVNSRHAMPNGGTITIATELMPAVAPPAIRIRVSDTGSGMDAATKAQAFEPFFTTKGEGGTGLGLSVVQNIVRLAGGTLDCESEPGHGTTIGIQLPLVDGVDGAANAPVPVRFAPRPHGSFRVALVDDDLMVRGAVIRALTAAGIEVYPVPLPVDVADLERRLGRADALITDIVMPGLTGPDLVDELRKRGCRTPVLFVSGHAEHALIERARNTPNAVLLAKPFTADDVLARLEEIGAREGDAR
jgi:two-component system cell cycle sensor histidine kinase/response regulator CckA